MEGRGDSDRQRGYGRGVHEYYAHYADNADAKIAALFAVNLAVAGLLLSGPPEGCLAEALRWLALGLHAGAGACLGNGIYPRVAGPGVDVLFWERVRRYETEHVYADEVANLSPADVERVYAKNNYFVADVLHRKFRAVRAALWLTACALALGATSVLVA